MSGDPIYVEIDEASWRGPMDNVEAWLGKVLTSHAAFRQLLDEVHPRLHEPHVRKIVSEIAETARRQESEAERSYKLIGRDPSAGGAEGSWRGLKALLPASLEVQSAFAVAEQLALALGLREMAEAAFAIEDEQATGHLVLKELMLEAAAIAILSRAPV